MAHRHRRKSIPMLGALAAVLVHALLLTPMMLGGASARHPRQPEAVGSAANAGSPAGTSTERLILLELGTRGRTPVEPAPQANLPQLALAPTLLQILGPDNLPLKPLVVDPEGESSQSHAADLIARTQLMGIYEGQIRARIERAWRRPRAALADRQFHCRVRIQQDARGNVLAVRLQDCEGTQEWFDSMVNAVKAASPLPAPPNPAVFAETFQMSFHAVSYRDGDSEEGYEPVRPERVASTVQNASGVEPSGATSSLPTLSTMPATGDVILRGEGNIVEWIGATQADPASAVDTAPH